jgi:hypothetical protein
MADTLYPKGKEKLLRAQINMDNDTICAVLLSDGYVLSAAHEFLASVAAFTVGDPVELAGKSTAGGVFDCNDPEFLALPAGQVAQAVVIYKNTGVPETSALIGYFDNVTGFPAQTNGGNLLVRISNGANKLFAL